MPVSPPHDRIQVPAGPAAGADRLLTPEALDLLALLVRRFGAERDALLARRAARQRRFLGGELPDFLPATEGVRSGFGRVAPAPADLDDRRVEITGRPAGHRLEEAADLLDRLVGSAEFPEFLTLEAYGKLD